ncbi:MAG: hypothetical protein ACREEW_14520 [Caulobacteraceae bacterium]
MLRRLLAVAIMVGLGACAGLGGCAPARSAFAFLTPRHSSRPPAPRLADGLWAILGPGCAKPNAANIHAWPACASPVWIRGDKALVILDGKVAAGNVLNVSYAASLRFSAGDPLIAQVGTQKDGYVFLALTDLSRDGQGRLVGAVGGAVACPGPAGRADLSAKLSRSGCATADPAMVRKAAAQTLRDHAALSQAAWIAPGAPEL